MAASDPLSKEVTKSDTAAELRFKVTDNLQARRNLQENLELLDVEVHTDACTHTCCKSPVGGVLPPFEEDPWTGEEAKRRVRYGTLREEVSAGVQPPVTAERRNEVRREAGMPIILDGESAWRARYAPDADGACRCLRFSPMGGCS